MTAIHPERKYGDAVVHSHGLNNAPMLTTKALLQSKIGMFRISCGIDNIGMTPCIPREDTFIAAVYLSDVEHHELWSRGRPKISQGYAANSMRIVNLEAGFSARVSAPHEAAGFYIPRSVLSDFGDETNLRATDLKCAPGVVDPIVAHLTNALLPAFKNPEEYPSIFVDHVGLALLAHLTRRYGGVQQQAQSSLRRGLSLLQEKRAKDYLAANAHRDILLADVAKECGLSRGHFAASFAKTTGVTPHKWLQKYRLHKARSMLMESSIPIAEIAILCGFADQSHLTRIFARNAGMGPAAWRRSNQVRRQCGGH